MAQYAGKCSCQCLTAAYPPSCPPADLSPAVSAGFTEGTDYISPQRAAQINKESVFTPLQSQQLANERAEDPDKDKIRQHKKTDKPFKDLSFLFLRVPPVMINIWGGFNHLLYG